MSLKVFMTKDMPAENGGFICAVIIANDELEARFILEKDLKNDDVSVTDQFGIPLRYTMTTIKMYRPAVEILSYGDDH